MSLDSIAIFSAIGSKMDFLNQRQGVIAQNVANADTPGYRPRDLVEPDFGKVLKDVSDTGGIGQVSMDATSANHLDKSGLNGGDADSKKQKDTYEVSISGNAVVTEEQLIKSGKNVMDYNLMANLYQKNIGLIKTALGTV